MRHKSIIHTMIKLLWLLVSLSVTTAFAESRPNVLILNDDATASKWLSPCAGRNQILKNRMEEASREMEKLYP